MSKNKSTIAIIGSGFSGTMVAVHLLNSQESLKVVLVEKSDRFARGAAYGTMCPLHLLNVPAGAMSAFSEDSDHFLDFAHQKDSAITSGSFAKRLIYAEYIEGVLAEAEKNKSASTEFEKITAQAIAITPGQEGATITLNNGQTLFANKIVLALGNYAPANPHVKGDQFYQSENYIQDPWKLGKLKDEKENVLLIGTGLTMVDTALLLQEQGHQGNIYAISRHGLLPQIHRYSLSKLPSPFTEGRFSASPTKVMHFLRRSIKSQGGQTDWRQVTDSLRTVTQGLWKKWSDAERSQFLRHLRSLWDVHRHRIAPEVGEMIDALKAKSQLHIFAGRICEYEENATGVDVKVRLRKTGEQESFHVSHVINCTGPESNYSRIDDPLVVSLRTQGLLACDSLKLGLAVTDKGALIGENGKPSTCLYTLGPPLRGMLWESVAVPELRVQAEQLSAHLLSALAPAVL